MRLVKKANDLAVAGQVSQLNALGFDHAIVIIKDVSVRTVGSVEALFRGSYDAKRYCRDLCDAYSRLGLGDAFEVWELKPEFY